jgi:hypothetical protein
MRRSSFVYPLALVVDRYTRPLSSAIKPRPTTSGLTRLTIGCIASLYMLPTPQPPLAPADDLAAEPLQGSGFEDETPDPEFDEEAS